MITTLSVVFPLLTPIDDVPPQLTTNLVPFKSDSGSPGASGLQKGGSVAAG